MLTTKQFEWAKQHDWFDRVENDRLFVIERIQGFANKIIEWTGTFAQLREWAGY